MEIDTDTPKGRLLAFCRMAGLTSNREIEKLLELGNGYFRSADKGMNTGTICKVARRYPSLNLNWLICGVGQIYNTDTRAASFSAVAESRPQYNAASSYRPPASVPVRIVESPEELLSGAAAGLPPRWLMMQGELVRGREDALVRIVDESLSPVYPVGEYLHVSPVGREMLASLPAGEKRLWVVSLRGSAPMVRLVGRYADRTEVFVLSALNADRGQFPDLLCDLGQIETLWSVSNVFHL